MAYNNREYKYDFSPDEGETGEGAFKRIFGRYTKGNVKTMQEDSKFTDMTIKLGFFAGFKNCLFKNCTFTGGVTTIYEKCVFVNPTFIHSVHASIFEGEECILIGKCMVSIHGHPTPRRFKIEEYADAITAFNKYNEYNEYNKNTPKKPNTPQKSGVWTVLNKPKTEPPVAPPPPFAQAPNIESYFYTADELKQEAAKKRKTMPRKQSRPPSHGAYSRRPPSSKQQESSASSQGAYSRHPPPPRQESPASSRQRVSAPDPINTARLNEPVYIVECINYLESIPSKECDTKKKFLFGDITDEKERNTRYHKIMMKIHPDRHTGESYKKLTQEITSAYTNCIKNTQSGGSKKRRTVLKARKTRKSKK